MVRLCAGLLIASGSLAFLMFSVNPQPTDTPSQHAVQDSIYASGEWIELSGANRDALVKRAIERATSGWRAAGLDEQHLAELGSLSTSFLLSVLWADFGPYKRATADLELTFNSDMAEELLELYRAWGLYPELDELKQQGRSTLHRFGHTWERPEPRSMAISLLDVESVSGGVGLEIDRDQWPYQGWQAQLSMFRRESGALTTEEGEQIERTGRSAYIIFRVGLADERRGHIRLTMFEDPVSKRWLPLDVVTGVEPGESNRAMIPML